MVSMQALQSCNLPDICHNNIRILYNNVFTVNTFIAQRSEKDKDEMKASYRELYENERDSSYENF